jgi:hypothetical protein
MPWGQYRGVPLAEVPGSYLLAVITRQHEYPVQHALMREIILELERRLQRARARYGITETS